MAEDKIVLTPDEAAGLLLDGKYVHNLVNPGMNLLVGCDFEREAAIAAFRKAVQIELGGDACMRMKHPIAVWDTKTHCSFFAADMEKVRAFEAAKVVGHMSNVTPLIPMTEASMRLLTPEERRDYWLAVARKWEINVEAAKDREYQRDKDNARREDDWAGA